MKTTSEILNEIKESEYWYREKDGTIKVKRISLGHIVDDNSKLCPPVNVNKNEQER